MTREQEKLIHKVKVVKASAMQLAKDATFLEEELGRLYGPAPKKSVRVSTEMETRILNNLRSRTINKKALAVTKAR